MAREEVAAAEQAAATNESEAATLRSEVERLEGLLTAEKASHEEEMCRGAWLGDQLQTAYQEKVAPEEEIETLKGSATTEGKGMEEGCDSVAARAGTPKDQGVVPPTLDDTDTGYDAKAHEILGLVRRSGFRHKKTKKKRGTYRGEQIDQQTHSIKFENSDDEANALSFPKNRSNDLAVDRFLQP
uniref:Srp40 C-terminal domain-containing protein n=1 Tax=Zea mays TaxID=4577 RepID=A0A804RAN7_MAIZE